MSKQGSLLLNFPKSNGLQWIQGIQKVTKYLKSPRYPHSNGMDNKFNLTTPANFLADAADNLYSRLCSVKVAAGPSQQDLLLAAVIFWALGKDRISTNMLMREHHLGWNRAADIVQQLEKLGIVDKLYGKRSRYVRPKSINDLSDEMVKFMECCNYPRNSLNCAFQKRRTSP